MTEIRAIVPADLEDWIKFRLAEGGYPDPAEYLFDLVRRDQLGLVAEEEPDTPEYIAWVREKIAEGEASGISDENPLEFIDKLITQCRARSG